MIDLEMEHDVASFVAACLDEPRTYYLARIKRDEPDLGRDKQFQVKPKQSEGAKHEHHTRPRNRQSRTRTSEKCKDEATVSGDDGCLWWRGLVRAIPINQCECSESDTHSHQS